MGHGVGQVCLPFFRNNSHEEKRPVSVENEERKDSDEKGILEDESVPRVRVLEVGLESGDEQEDHCARVQQEHHDGEDDVADGLPLVELGAHRVVLVVLEETHQRDDQVETGHDQQSQCREDYVEFEKQKQGKNDQTARNDKQAGVGHDVEVALLHFAAEAGGNGA